MNGIIITVIVVLLVAVIGLGFGILTLQEKIDGLHKELNDCTTYEQYKRFTSSVADEFFEARHETSVVAQSVGSLRSEFAQVKRDVYGTASEPEFCHMKTMVTQILPNRIKRLEDVIGIHDETEITYDGLVPHQEEK